ncbi:MAG: helix-turn-helix domain-containing protein [Candidatus Taylorbacteria bacterium]|nr:helix-turn-helix domain-containing protein [Candidatus Taylorbacteria bacterium]
MNIEINIIILIIAGIIAVALGYWLGKRKFLNETRVKQKSLIEKQAEEKKLNLEAILGLMESGNQPLTNNYVEQMLGISDATAERYLQELENEGLVRQVGNTGKDVFYEKV